MKLSTVYKVWAGENKALRGEFSMRSAADQLMNELQQMGIVAWVQVVYPEKK